MTGKTSDIGATLFKSAKAFETWLKRHHATSDGLWVKIAKKGVGEPSVTYPEAVEIALCWGWIDGQKKALDAQHFLQRFTPRRSRSIWSKINVDKVEALVAAGRMQPAGQAQIDAAKADGRWGKAYDSARTASVPDDLQAALEASPQAKAFFATIMHPTATRCCGACRRRSSRRRAPSASASWWRCSRVARSCTSSNLRSSPSTDAHALFCLAPRSSSRGVLPLVSILTHASGLVLTCRRIDAFAISACPFVCAASHRWASLGLRLTERSTPSVVFGATEHRVGASDKSFPAR